MVRDTIEALIELVTEFIELLLAGNILDLVAFFVSLFG